MLSGTDLIKASGQIHERAQRLKAVASSDVQAVESPAQSNPSLDQGTQDALQRFARFINQEGQKKKSKSPAKGLPKAYQDQIQNLPIEEKSGGILNIYR